MNPDAALPTFRLADGTTIAQALPPRHPAVTLASPAAEVVTDLTFVKAASIPPRATLAEAEQAMIQQGVRMLFVVSDWPAVEGLITTTDLHGDRQMRLVHQRSVRYGDLAVADVMTALAEIDAVDHAALEHATVGNLVATLRRFGRNHLLVVQAASASEPQRIRGIVSRSQIERQLGRPIDVTEVAESFAEIERALA
jgi:CBS domain containing-hemolysin-like protein